VNHGGVVPHSGARSVSLNMADASGGGINPAYTASGVRRYIHEELYPHLLTAVQAMQASRPSNPTLFLSNCLLGLPMEEDQPGQEQSASAEGGAADVMEGLRMGALQEAIMACVREKPRPADPVAFIGNYLKATVQAGHARPPAV
jgi:hypothetical protein